MNKKSVSEASGGVHVARIQGTHYSSEGKAKIINIPFV